MLHTINEIYYFQLLHTNIAGEFYYPDCEYTGMSCLNCRSQKMCLWGTLWSSTDCANEIAGYSNPYCNPETNKCTNIRPEGCPRITSVSCLRDDVFPDTNDCTVYYQCTNSSAELVPCPNNFIYSQRFGKCVFKLTNDDCVNIDGCGVEDFVKLYPGDSSLYYGCSSSVFYFETCSPSEFFNTTTLTCETRCGEVGLLPVPQNCTKYYVCTETESGLIALEETCPDGYGFNPILLSCEKDYSVLCNEFAILENNKYDFLSKIPIIRAFTCVIRKICNLINLNPVKILFIFRLSNEDLSTFILVTDYIYQNRRLPPNITSVLLQFIVENLPSEFQVIYNILSQLGIMNFKASSRSPRSISLNASLQNYLDNEFNGDDLVSLVTQFDVKNNDKTSGEIFQQVFSILQISKEQIPIIITTLKKLIPGVANRVNSYTEWPLLLMDEQSSIRINVNVLDQTMDGILKLLATRLQLDNNNSRLFDESAKEQYFIYREEIKHILGSLYLNLNFI